MIQVEGRPVRLRVNPRARRVSLRLDARAGEVVAVAPSARRLKDAAAFAEARSGWIAARLASAPARTPFAAGRTLHVGGDPHRIERAAARIRPRLVAPTADEPARLIASGEGEAFSRAVLRVLRAEALARLTEATGRRCETLRLPPPAIRLQDARSRWGSCRQASSAGPAVIRYSWRLVLGPPEVLDYVVAHECAHLLEANHGPRFWAVVARLYGDCADARAWLRVHGAELHAVG